MGDERDFKGVWIPKDLWLSKELKPMEKFFLLEIDSLDRSEGCFASNAHFSELFGVSKGRCTQIIKKLEADGWLKVDVIRNGKIIVKRVVRVVNKLNNPSEKIKQPSEKIKQPYLENDEGNNTNTNNTNEYKNITPSGLLESVGITDIDLINDFITHRKSLKAPITKTALNGFVRESKKAGISLSEALTISIERGWKGFRAEWNMQDTQKSQNAPGQGNNSGSTNGNNYATNQSGYQQNRRQHHATISDHMDRKHKEAVAEALANGSLWSV